MESFGMDFIIVLMLHAEKCYNKNVKKMLLLSQVSVFNFKYLHSFHVCGVDLSMYKIVG